MSGINLLGRWAALACLLLPHVSAEDPSLIVKAPRKWLFGAGSTVQFTVHATDAAGAVVERPEVAWETTDPSVAVVDEAGLVQATGFGQVEIRATWGEIAASASLRIAPDVPWETDPGRAVAFLNVNVATMRDAEILERQIVVARGGRISAVGPAGEVEIPEDAVRIDAEGLYLMPGLVDMHCHFLHGNPHWRNDLYLYAANGVSTVREMFGSTEFLPYRTAAASGAVFSPTLYLSSQGLDGPETRFGIVPVTSPAQARQLVSTYKAQGFDFIKVYTDLRQDVWEAALDQARQEGIRVVGHAPTRVPFETVATSSQASIEHVQLVWSQVVSGGFFKGTADEAKLDYLVTLIRDSGVWIVPTIFVGARSAATVMAQRERPEMRYVSAAMKQWFHSPSNVMPASNIWGLEANLKRITKRLHDAGVNLMLGSDCGYGDVIPGFAIHDELRMTVEAGLSPYEALRLATVAPARFLGTLEDTGTVEPGKRADLLLLEENPLEDVANAAKRVGVLLGGRWQSEKRLQQGLEEIARAYGN